MAAGLTLALAMFAQAAPIAQPPAAAPQSSAGQKEPESAPACSEPRTDGDRIVICTERPQGYRLDPNVMEANREKHSGGRPVRPGGKPLPDCATGVGPQACLVGGISPIGVALTAAEMAKRIATGEEVGSMFVTDPNPTEYQLYMMAKARREAEEAERIAAEAREKAAARQKQQASEPATTGVVDPSRD